MKKVLLPQGLNNPLFFCCLFFQADTGDWGDDWGGEDF